MKKIIAIVAFSVFVATQAFALTTIPMKLDSSGTQGGSLWGAKTGAAAGAAGSILIGKTSTGVGLGGMFSAVAYAIITQHKSGNKGFGSSYDSTAVYYKDRNASEIGTPVDANPEHSDSSAFAAWTSM